jgi:hypothetical protein
VDQNSSNPLLVILSEKTQQTPSRVSCVYSRDVSRSYPPTTQSAISGHIAATKAIAGASSPKVTSYASSVVNRASPSQPIASFITSI